MAMCILGQRGVFSRQYDNLHFKGYDVDTLIERVTELLEEKRPEVLWLPHTSEVGVEHDSLREARAENNVNEIAVLMAELWEQAKQEYKATVSKEKLDLMEQAERCPNCFDLDLILLKIQELEERSGLNGE